ncbi:Fic family protein [Oscillospiraceae bacterium OttesenSCG-928-F05]|nr:Fic family protein [Oscillospiraceae bacterium OttesenSCG-928-F05]
MMNLLGLLTRIDRNRKRINAYRPLSPQEVKELDNYYRIGVTFTSNALEGNSLTLTETKVLIEDGITVGGKPIKDCYEATGHAKAYDFMLGMARAERLEITEDDIKQLHRLFYAGIDGEEAGRYRSGQVFISGTEYVPPGAGDVPALMEAFVSDLRETANDRHPVLLAAFAHRRLVDIHPFIDGNGRTARLLMNLILINRGYQVVSIPPVLRADYVQALIAAQRTDDRTDTPFYTLIAECELEAQKDYFRMFCIPEREEKQPDEDKTER